MDALEHAQHIFRPRAIALRDGKNGVVYIVRAAAQLEIHIAKDGAGFGGLIQEAMHVVERNQFVEAALLIAVIVLGFLIETGEARFLAEQEVGGRCRNISGNRNVDSAFPVPIPEGASLCRGRKLCAASAVNG